MKYTLRVVSNKGRITYPVTPSVFDLGNNVVYSEVDITNSRIVSFEEDEFPMVKEEMKRLHGGGSKAKIVSR